MAQFIVPFNLTWQSIADRRMLIPRVVPLDPRGHRALQSDQARLFAQPEQFLFQGPDDPFLVGILLRLTAAGEGLNDAYGMTALANVSEVG